MAISFEVGRMADVAGNKGVDNAAPDMQALMTQIAKALVDEPEAVQVEAIQEGDSTLLRLRVAPGDIGKVIGKQGRTARSLRTILGAASMKLQHRFGLDIVETDHDNHE
jgi:predicted RNA-binding protein YlqC (UPF0109 family)